MVIEIPGEVYGLLKYFEKGLGLNDKKEDDDVKTALIRAVVNGTPLPKGHGRLKDIDKFLKKVEEDRIHECYMRSWTIDDVLQKLDSWYVPTIIEADKESEDKE